jgi:hypothetical protein
MNLIRFENDTFLVEWKRNSIDYNLKCCIMGNFQNLRVWQLAKELAVEMYKVTSKSSLSKDYGLKDQILRSAVSISANIAEGDELGTNRQSIRHFYIAKGSSPLSR